MEYFIPSSNSSQPRSSGSGSVPVNPSIVPGSRSFPSPASDWALGRMPPAPPPVMPEPIQPHAPMPIPAPPPSDDECPLATFEASVPPEGSYMAFAENAPEENPVFNRFGMPDVSYRPEDADRPPSECMPSCGHCSQNAGGLGAPLPSGAPEMLFSPLFTPGFLSGQIGRIMRVESLAGNTLTERIGRLLQVGADFLLLQSIEGHHVMCDLKAVKFVTIVSANEFSF